MFILLVDNNKLYTSGVKNMLLKAGFNRIEKVESGIECLLQIYKGEIPDVIVIDEKQCHAIGIDLLKNIRVTNPDLTLIILTDKKSLIINNPLPSIGSLLYFAKESINADNLPQVLYTIFTEKISTTKKPRVPSATSLYRKSLAGILN
jgi:DNA-binding NarL/FixJ family response regulator